MNTYQFTFSSAMTIKWAYFIVHATWEKHSKCHQGLNIVQGQYEFLIFPYTNQFHQLIILTGMNFRKTFLLFFLLLQKSSKCISLKKVYRMGKVSIYIDEIYKR